MEKARQWKKKITILSLCSNSCKCINNEFPFTDMCKYKDCINIKYETNEEIKVNIAFDVPDIE